MGCECDLHFRGARASFFGRPLGIIVPYLLHVPPYRYTVRAGAIWKLGWNYFAANVLPPTLTRCRPPTTAHVRQWTPDRQRTATSVDTPPSANGRPRASTDAEPSTDARVRQQTPDRQRTPASGNAPDASTDAPVCCREHSSTDLNRVDVHRCANAHPLWSTRVPGGVMTLFPRATSLSD